MYTAKCKEENVKSESLQIAEEISRSLSFLKSLSDESKKNKLYVEIKNTEDYLVRLVDKKERVLKDNRTDDDVIFIRNDTIFDQLKNENRFGIILSRMKPSAEKAVKVQYGRPINVKTFKDTQECDIAGMVLVSSTHMVVSDWCNRNIKMLDIDNEMEISRIMLSSRPRDIIKLPENTLAVALTNEKCIQLVSYTDTSLSSGRRLHVGEWCYCLAYRSGKLVVGCNCNPGKVIILDLDGKMVQAFDTPELFNGPEKIIISHDEKFLYVSEYTDYFTESSNCLKVDWQGNIVKRFQQPKYKFTKGIQELDDGTLLVCFHDSHNIVRLSTSFDKCEIVDLDEAELQNPQAMWYSENDRILYVSCSSNKRALYSRSNIIKAFSVKWV